MKNHELLIFHFVKVLINVKNVYIKSQQIALKYTLIFHNL